MARFASLEPCICFVCVLLCLCFGKWGRWRLTAGSGMLRPNGMATAAEDDEASK